MDKITDELYETALKEEKEDTGFFSKIQNYAEKYLNWKAGLLFGVPAAVAVGYVNKDYGELPAIYAGLKQLGWTFTIGGGLTRLSQYLGVNDNKLKAYVLGDIVPTSIVFTGTYLTHLYTGTPEPVASAMVPGIATFVLCPFIVYAERNKDNFQKYKDHFLGQK